MAAQIFKKKEKPQYLMRNLVFFLFCQKELQHLKFLLLCPIKNGKTFIAAKYSFIPRLNLQ